MPVLTGWFGCQHCRKNRCKHTPPANRVCPILKPIKRSMKGADVYSDNSWINLSTARINTLKGIVKK